MRKFLLSAAALMVSIFMMAAGTGDGTSKANAIDFEWASGHEHVGTKWYRVDLSAIDGMVDPTLALYLTNLSDVPTKVSMNGTATVSISFAGFSYTKDTTMAAEYTIAAKDYQLWSQNVKQLLEMNVRYLHLELTSAQNIMLSAKKYETSDIVDLACEQADDFDWSGVDVQAGEKWYRLNLAEVKAQNKKLNFVVANQGSQDATVEFDLSLDCPASVVFGYNWTIAAGADMTEEFGRVFIDELKEDYVYLKLATDQALRLSVEEMPAPAPVVETWVVDDVLKEGQAYTISGEHIFEVPMATLSAPRGMKAEFVITNNTGVDAVLTKQISFANPVKTTIDKELPVAANATVTKEVVNNMAGVINSQTAFIRFNATQELTVQLNYVVVNEEVMNAKPVEIASCEKSQLLDWNSTVKQSGLETKWYEIDLSTIKQNDEHLQLTFTNKSNNIVVVMGEILPSCASEDTIPYVCPVPAGKTINQVINYNLFALLPHPKHFYISATVIPTTATSIMEFKDVRSQADLMKFVPKDLSAIQEAEVELTANTISALVDPTACNQATTIARGVKYEQAAGTTKWYRVTDELLNKLSLIPDVAFINNGKQAANITLAASVDCEHSTFGMSTFSLPTWADLTVFPIRLLGDLMDKALNQDVTEMYLQVTTDQPIAFGIDIDYGFGLGCDDAREFDWTKGAVIEKGDAQWLKFDISSVKKNKQQVRLTLTNESNSLAWVAMLTSLTCPFDVALPMVFAIPAGTSIDKVVDYSYFAATKLDQLYVALITEEKISVKAVAEKSQASASDYSACANAVEVKNGEAYVQKPGTTWYKFDRSLFSDVSRLPKFRYAAEATTSLTMGVTVGCEYNIATRGTIKLPTTKGLEVSFRMPGFIYDVLDKFVHDDVEAVYVEMTTDQQIKFGIDMEYAGGCEKATKLDLSQPLDIDLTANKDVWYYLDLKDVRAMGDEKISFRLNNQSDKTVEVEFEVTPTCPLIVSAIKSVDVPAGVDLPLMVRASAITDLYDQVVAKFDVPDKIANNLPEQLTDDLIYYVRVRANGDLSIEEGDSIPEHVEPGCEEATPLDITKAIDVDKLQKGWYVVDLTTIKTDFSLKFVNNTGSNQTLDFQFYKGCELDEAKMLENYLTSYNFVVPTSGLEQKVPYSMISSYLTLDELYIYVNKQEGGEVDMACATARLIDPTQPFEIKIEAGQEQWFKIAPQAFNNFSKNLRVKAEADKNITVECTLATSCPALATIDRSFDLADGLTVDTLLTAGMINLAWEKYASKVEGIDTVYIRVLANGQMTLNVTPEDIVEPDVPAGCEDAILLDWTKTINLSSLETRWYRVDLTPLKNGVANKISINNDLGKTTGVRMDIFRNCEEGSFLYTYTQAFNIGLFEQTIPSSLVGMLGSINELYIYLTMDVDVLTCEDAIEFDWSKGAVHNAGETQWYHFDIDSVKNNAQQVKLTFTNHSSEWAVMYGEIALHCPYTYSIPYACVVPAGMSVDKVVDYSVFAASRVEELYVKVYSTETVELAASSESALVFDQTPCNKATLVATGGKYTQQAGTSWYKFSKDLFQNTGKLPKFYFTTEAEGLTTITLGATVGCEYNIATKTIVKVPGSLNYAVVVPEQLFDFIDKMVNDEVTEVYVEMTTDKAVTFSVDMINETPDPCHEAELLDITKGINLEANVDKWYKVDLDALKALNGDVALTMINPSAEAVEVDMEFSLTCPIVVSLNKSLTVPAVAELTKVISASTIAKIPGVSFYVRLKASADLSIKLAEPELPEDQDACEDALWLDWTKTINLSDLRTGWYKFDLTQLHADQKDFTLAFNNDSDSIAKLGMDLYEHCTSAKIAGTVYNFPIGVTTKTISYASVTSMIGTSTVMYVYLNIELQEIPKEACENAIDYVWGQPTTVVAGSDVWYAIDITAAKTAGKDLYVTVKNVDKVATTITAEMLYDCPGVVMHSLTKTIGAGEAMSTTIAAAEIQGISSNVLYLHLVTTGDIEITVGEPTPPVTPEACLDAIPYILGQDIVLVGGDDKWFSIDVAAIRAMKEDMNVTVTNATNDTVKVTLELAYECPVTTFETTITDKPIDPMTSFTETIGIDVLEAHADVNIAYLHVVSTGDLTINVAPDTTVVPVPEACELGDTIVWTSGMTLQIAEAVDKWYTVDISEASANKYDVKITVENNTGADVNATIDVYTTCPVGSAVRSATQTIYSYSETTKKVMYDQYSKHNTDWLYIHVITSGSLDISSEHIVYPKTYEYKTITEYVCDGTAFVDPITNDSVLISSLIADVFEWNDTVLVSPTLDSVYTFVVTPVVAPVKMNDSILATITSAIPVLKQGELPVVDASVTAIKAYYQGLDTEAISDVVTLTWKHNAGIIPCDATTYTMTLMVEDECDNVLETAFVFNVEARTVTETTTSATVCNGVSYHWDITGKDYLLAGEYRDTLRTANGCDQEIRILNLTVLPEIKTVLNDTICFGEMYKGTIYTASTTITETFATANGCDSTAIVNLTVLPDVVYETPESQTICFGETYNWRGADRSASASDTLKNSLGCDSIIYTLNLTILPAVVNAPVETATVCFGETYNWRGVARSASASDTLKNSLGCDSIIYTLNLTVLPEAKVETEEWTLCPGDLSTPRDWHGQSISAAGNYEAIEKFAGTDCDSVIYQLTVIIPDADNNATMDNLPAVSKYNNRILMLNINEIKGMFDGWVPAEADVQWFRVVGTQDAAYAAWNKLGDDESLSNGHYYNLPDGGTLPPGQYYALVWRSSEICDGGEIMRTVLLTCEANGAGPRLVPNVARANETLTLENLNPSDVNEIRVYSSTGQLIETYTAEQVSKFIFNAATVSGYYMVDVENKNNKVTLRYVVK